MSFSVNNADPAFKKAARDSIAGRECRNVVSVGIYTGQEIAIHRVTVIVDYQVAAQQQIEIESSTIQTFPGIV